MDNEKKTLSGREWEIFCEIARNEPNKEHTELRSVAQAAASELYSTYRYGSEPPEDARGCTLMSFRNAKGELMVTKMKQRKHELVVAMSGAGKTQGCILNEALNMDGKTSYIFTDPKGEVTERTYEYAVKKYGKDNVIIANYMQPQFSHVKINPLVKLARKWLSVENAPEHIKTAVRDNIITEITKFLEVTFVIKSIKDPTWEETARNFIFAIIMGLIEDLTLTPEQERLTKRVRTYPEQVNFATVRKIFNSFSWERSMEDHGFLSKREHRSLAYQNSKAVINNANNTRANYLQFVENFLRPFVEPKINQMSSDDTFDFESMATTPKVLFVIYDLSDVNVREWVNNVLSDCLQNLLAFSHKTSKPFDVPVVFACDEFPSLQPHKIYPTILETGRGSNLFMMLSVQSLSQIKARYPDDYVSMLENCAVRVFLGTNDTNTAKAFIDNMGQTTVPSASAYLHGRYSSEAVNVVTIDELMHRMSYGESFICVDREMPIHGNYELYYITPEYTANGITPNDSHGPLTLIHGPSEYYASWLDGEDDDDDDDDDDDENPFFRHRNSKPYGKKKAEYKPGPRQPKPEEYKDLYTDLYGPNIVDTAFEKPYVELLVYPESRDTRWKETGADGKPVAGDERRYSVVITENKGVQRPHELAIVACALDKSAREALALVTGSLPVRVCEGLSLIKAARVIRALRECKIEAALVYDLPFGEITDVDKRYGSADNPDRKCMDIIELVAAFDRMQTRQQAIEKAKELAALAKEQNLPEKEQAIYDRVVTEFEKSSDRDFEIMRDTLAIMAG